MPRTHTPTHRLLSEYAFHTPSNSCLTRVTAGVFTKELNPDNPLGMRGEIALSFGALLQRIWSDASQSTSYPPREFKSVLSRFAPQFSGYQQHDTQEFVAFLLDGLHEDLNRVLKKPYVEKPDWNGGDDFELVKLARSSWEGYMKRNDSVIVDLFQGQYKSTLVCPECNKVSFTSFSTWFLVLIPSFKVSITFDPFMYLTLPLPVNKKWRHEIYYIPWDTSKLHVKIPVELNRDSTFRDLRNLLGRWMRTNPDNVHNKPPFLWRR
jgi:ubiquitin carboxyl-terminal hydrolase 4/11/15